MPPGGPGGYMPPMGPPGGPPSDMNRPPMGMPPPGMPPPGRCIQ